MSPRPILVLLRVALGLITLINLSSCSREAPVAPMSLDKVWSGPDDCPDCPQVNFAARIELMDHNRRELTFFGRPDTAVALENTEMVRVKAGNHFRVQFGDLRINDSVEINGYRHHNGEIYINRIRVHQTDSCYNWDLSFRDQIASIDYANGTLTVVGRPELVTTDDNTLIWGTISGGRQLALSGGQNQNRHYLKQERDTTFAFTDLQIGDVVEVKAAIVDANTLLAVSVKIANCNERQCITFTAAIAVLDANARTISFVGQTWAGLVCPHARLLDVDGNDLTLNDFAVGELVTVKGLPTTENALRICEMVKVE